MKSKMCVTVRRRETTMRRASFLCIALVVSTVPAFSPPSLFRQPRRTYPQYEDTLKFPKPSHVASSLFLATKTAKLPPLQLLTSPFKKLPWNAAKERAREARRLKQEGTMLYRELGVAEDATFEEIQEATQNLLLRYEGDLKKRVKVEITKDKIMQLRLNQRLSGMARETKEARAASYLRDDADNYKPKTEWEPPAWTKGLVVKPDEKWRDTCVIFFGSICAIGILSPGMADGLKIFGFILGAAFLGQRGTPEMEPGAGPRERVGKHTALAFAIAFVVYAFSSAFATAFTRSIPSIWDNKIRSGVQNLIVSGSMGLAVAFLQPYKKK